MLLEKVIPLVAVLPLHHVLLDGRLDVPDKARRNAALAPATVAPFGALTPLVPLAPLAPPRGPARLLILCSHHRRGVQDRCRPPVVVFGELRVVPRNRVAVLHEPGVDLVLDALPHLLALHFKHLLLKVYQCLVVVVLVLRLHPLPPLQVRLQHGLGRRSRLFGLRDGPHPDELQLLERLLVHPFPHDVASHNRLDHGSRPHIGVDQARLLHAQVQRLLLLDYPLRPRAHSPLPPALVHLDHPDSVLLRQRWEGDGGQLLLVRGLQPMLLHQRLQELLALHELLCTVRHKVARDGYLHHCRVELQVHQNVVEVHSVGAPVEPNQPRADL